MFVAGACRLEYIDSSADLFDKDILLLNFFIYSDKYV